MIENILCEDGALGFTVKWDINEASASIEVYEIVGQIINDDDTNGPYLYENRNKNVDDLHTENINETQRYLNAMIKWDACSHFYFGDNDGYIHICGFDMAIKHIKLIQYLFKRAFELMRRTPYSDIEQKEYDQLMSF